MVSTCIHYIALHRLIYCSRAFIKIETEYFKKIKKGEYMKIGLVRHFKRLYMNFLLEICDGG